MKRVLIAANGMSVKGGIGNCLYRMLQVIRDECPECMVDLMLCDTKSADILSDQFPNIRVLPIHQNSLLSQSSGRLLIQSVRGEKTVEAMELLGARVLYKMHIALPLIRLTAKGIPRPEECYDVAISYSSIPSCLCNFIAAHVTAARKYAWVHGDIDQGQIKKIPGSTSLRIRGLKQYRRIMQHYDRIIAVSHGVKRSVQMEFPDEKIPTQVIHNITDAACIRGMADEKVVTFPGEGLKLLTVGRLSNEKGFDLALKTMRHLQKAGIPFRWYFLGHDQRTARMKRTMAHMGLEDRFVYLGTTENPYPYFKACDLYVHPSYVEGYCTAVEEARMLGKAVVMTNVAGSEEQIRNGWNGFVVKKDSRCLYEAIRTLAEQPELRHRFEKNAAQISWNNQESIQAIRALLEGADLPVLAGDENRQEVPALPKQ